MIGNLQITTKSGKIGFTFKVGNLDNLNAEVYNFISNSHITGQNFYEEPNSGDLHQLIKNLGLVLGKSKKFDYSIGINFIQNKVVINKYKLGKISSKVLNKEFIDITDVVLK